MSRSQFKKNNEIMSSNMFRISYLVSVLVLLIKTAASGQPQKILLSVYYESQCPDSRNFVVEQLQPAMELLNDYIELQLIPFGKARSISATSFKCQHGPTECMGNMVQGCTIDIMESRISNIRLVKYVACELESEAGTRKDMRCVRKSGANSDRVNECISSNHGIELQKKYERMTKTLKPKYIPTITLDNVFSQGVQNSALRDLMGTLCARLQGAKPCAHR